MSRGLRTSRLDSKLIAKARCRAPPPKQIQPGNFPVAADVKRRSGGRRGEDVQSATVKLLGASKVPRFAAEPSLVPNAITYHLTGVPRANAASLGTRQRGSFKP